MFRPLAKSDGQSGEVLRKSVHHPTRSIARAVVVLKAIAARKQIGWRLSDLASTCGLDVATTYRILQTLAGERLIHQRSEDKRYVPGALLFELSLSILPLHSFQLSVRPMLESIATNLRGIAFLYLRSGDDSVCVDRVGASTVHPLTEIGSRRPMARSTSGIAMLLKLPKEDQAFLVRRAAAQSTNKNRDRSYRIILETSRKFGFGLNEGKVVPGLPSVDMALLDSQNRPVGAIGLMGPAALITGARLERVARILRDAAEEISRRHGNEISSFIY